MGARWSVVVGGAVAVALALLGIESSSANGSGNVAKRNGLQPQCIPSSLCA